MTAIIATIAGSVVLMVFSEVSSAQFESEAGGMEVVCAGFYGCGGPVFLDLLGPLVLIIVAVFIISIVGSTKPTERGNDVVSVKKRYVDENGNIQTIVELEAELDDAIDAKDLWDDL